MVAALVQHADFGIHTSGTGGAGGGQVSSTTYTATFSAATAGNYLILAFTLSAVGSLATISSVVDSAGHSWTLVTQANSANFRSAMYYIVASGGETSVTITLSVANIAIWEVREYSGILGLDTYDQPAYEKSSIAISSATPQPTYQDGLHLYWIAASDSRSKTSMELSTNTTRGEISGTGWVLHGARGYNTGTNGGVPSCDSAGGTPDMRNGTYTATSLLRGWMLDKTSGTGSDKAHISNQGDGSGFTGRHCIGSIWRTSSTPTATENGSGTGAASVVGNGRASSTASGTSITITTPTCVAGDLLIAIIQPDTLFPITADPSGWTAWGPTWDAASLSGEPSASFAGGDFGRQFTLRVYYRVCDGTEAASYTWTVSGSSAKRGYMMCIRSGTPYSGTTWQLQAPAGHLHSDDGGVTGYKITSGRRADPAADCMMIVFFRGLNSVSAATGFTSLPWTGTNDGMVFYRSVSTSGPWEIRTDLNSGRALGILSFTVLGAPSGQDHWSWAE